MQGIEALEALLNKENPGSYQQKNGFMNKARRFTSTILDW